MNNIGVLLVLMGFGGGTLLLAEATGIGELFGPAAKLTGTASMLIVTLVVLKMWSAERKSRDKLVNLIMLIVRHCPGVSQEAIDIAMSESEDT